MQVGPAGIVKSSFYSFFDSKEALYLELLAHEAPAVEARVLPPPTAAAPARQAIEQFLAAMLAVLETNSLARRLLTHPEELAMVPRECHRTNWRRNSVRRYRCSRSYRRPRSGAKWYRGAPK